MPVVWPTQAGEPTWMCSDLQLQLGSLWMVRNTYVRTVSSGGTTAKHPILANPEIGIEDRGFEDWRGDYSLARGLWHPFSYDCLTRLTFVRFIITPPRQALSSGTVAVSPKVVLAAQGNPKWGCCPLLHLSFWVLWVLHSHGLCSVSLDPLNEIPFISIHAPTFPPAPGQARPWQPPFPLLKGSRTG